MNKMVGATNMGGGSAMSIRDVVSRCALAIGLFLGGDLSASAAPAITLLPLVGPPKTKLVISGTGFDPTQLIDIYFDTTDFCLAASDALGAFSCTINVPSSAQPQNHWITAAERVNGLAAQKAFTVRTDWPQFHGRDAKHTGYNKFENTLTPSNVADLDILWRKPIGVPGTQSTPVISGGIAYVGGLDGKLYAFNAATGTTVTGFPKTLGGPVQFSAAAVGVGNVYIATSAGDHKLYAFKAKTGGAVAAFPIVLGGNIDGSPTLYAGNIYVPCYDGKLYAFNAVTAAPVPGFPVIVDAGFSIDATPSIANDRLFIGSFDGKLYGFNALNGSTLPNYPVSTGGLIESTAALAGGEISFGSDDGHLYRLRDSDGSSLGAFSTSDSIVSSPAVRAREVVFERGGVSTAAVVSIDKLSNTLRWSTSIEPTPGPFAYASPLIANGVIYANSPHALYALEDGSGAVLWRGSVANSGLASPAISDGVVFLGSTDGFLYAFSEGGLAPASRLPGGALGIRPAPSSLRPNISLRVN